MRLDKLRWHRRAKTCAVRIYSCSKSFQVPQSHLPWGGCVMTSLKGRSSFVISPLQTQGGTWTHQGTAPALADATISQSSAVQREFRPLSMVKSIHSHNPEVVLLFACCQGGFGWRYPPPSTLPNFPGPLTFWWLIFWGARASLAGLRLPGGVTGQGEPGVADIGKFRGEDADSAGDSCKSTSEWNQR